MFRLTLSDIAFAVLLWVLMIAKYGYTYGSSDHEELLVYVLFLKNPMLYAHDFFVQSLHGSLPNERTVMAQILLPFYAHLRLTIFLFHFFNTVLIILAFIKIAACFTKNKYAAWLSVFISFFILYNKGLGSVDAYSAAFQTSDLSSMVAAWALYFFLERRYVLASVIISVATFIHVLVGFDLMAVLSAIILWKYFLDKEISLKVVMYFFATYLFTAGIYLILVYRAKAMGDGYISDEELFKIMFYFRHPHHFIFNTFPVFTKILFVLYTTVALFYYNLNSRTVFQFIVVSIVVLFFYIIAVDHYHSIFIASFQWYKIVQWVKFFGSVAIVASLFHFVREYVPVDHKLSDYFVMGSGLVLGILMFYFYFHGDIAHGYKQYNEAEIDLSIKLKEITQPDAVFVQPFGFTAFKFYAQRSSYIDFKAIAKNKKDIRGWYQRIQEVYGINYTMKAKGFLLEQKADEYFNTLAEPQLQTLHAEGVTHIICKTDRYRASHKLILSENGYFVYEL